jgi:hypothetical protein
MGGVRGVLSRSDIDMFHEKPWAILTKDNIHPGSEFGLVESTYGNRHLICCCVTVP